MVKTMAKLRMVHASRHGARKPPGPTNVQPWEIPRSGSKAKDGEREKKERETELAHAKPPGPIENGCINFTGTN